LGEEILFHQFGYNYDLVANQKETEIFGISSKFLSFLS